MNHSGRINYLSQIKEYQLFQIEAFSILFYKYLNKESSSFQQDLFSQKCYYTIYGNFTKWCEEEISITHKVLKFRRRLDENDILQFKLIHGRFTVLVESNNRRLIYEKLGCQAFTYLRFACRVANQDLSSMTPVFPTDGFDNIVLMEGSPTRSLKKALQRLHHIYVPFKAVIYDRRN